MNLEESLRDLAGEDVHVSADVDAAVMTAWDAAVHGQARVPSWSWVPWTAACAAVVLAAALFPSEGRKTGTRSAAEAPAPLIREELVLVPELDRRAPLMLMRVRMTRREFSKLGVAIGNRDGDGLVDVEVLVGEDGVARSIRRAVAVGWTGPNR